MYASRTVCSRCIGQLRQATLPASRLTAKFASTSPGATTPSSHQREAWAVPHEGPSVSSASTAAASSPPSKSVEPGAEASEDRALDIFNQVVKKHKTKDAVPSSSGSTNLPESSLGDLELAAKLKIFSLKNPKEALSSFDAFKRDIFPHLAPMRGQLPKHLYVTLTIYLANVAKELRQRQWNGKVALDVLQIYSWLGNWDPQLRQTFILGACVEVLRLKNESKGKEERMMELLDLWKHISQEKRPSQVDQPLAFVFSTKQEIIRDVDRTEEDRAAQEHHPLKRWLASLFPQLEVPSACFLGPGLVSTLALLADNHTSTSRCRRVALPLTTAAYEVLRYKAVGTDIGVSALFADVYKGLFAGGVRQVEHHVERQWKNVVGQLETAEATRRSRRTDPQSDGEWQAPKTNSFSKIHKRLREAYRARNPAAINALWQDFTAKVQESPKFTTQVRTEGAEFLDFWIFVWCATKLSERSQEALDLMNVLGIRPTLKTYTAMMHGWKMCRDSRRIEALWTSLVQSGIKLDVFIWTERISALIETGKPQAGIEALATMMSLWKEAVKEGREQAAVKPNTEVVNAALKGLISQNAKAAREVLGWAASEGIEPNVRTYNILLRESFSSNAPDEVASILIGMKSNGVQPDGATFTIMIEELVGRMEDAAAEDHVRAVHQVFRDMAAAGLKPNLETYGKMLYAVASLANGADEAVEAVQRHMTNAGFRPTPHMITILIERILDRIHPAPSAAAAISSLLEKHSLTDVSQGDQTLWERVMTAYAVTGETTRAMPVFDDLARAGRPVTSLACLKELLGALLDGGEREKAKRVVDTVLEYNLKRMGSGDGDGAGGGERYWRHHFWFLAMQEGLIEEGRLPVEVSRNWTR